MINIKGLNKAEVLAALYNASKVQGMGFLQATGVPMEIKEAEELLKHTTEFDYLHGKVMKIDLSSDDEFKEDLYDRDNGEGAAQRVIERFHYPSTIPNVDKAYIRGAKVTTIIYHGNSSFEAEGTFQWLYLAKEEKRPVPFYGCKYDILIDDVKIAQQDDPMSPFSYIFEVRLSGELV